jgi:hypothetical protein
MTETDGNATAVDRIETVCDQLEELLAEIRAQARLLREETGNDG